MVLGLLGNTELSPSKVRHHREDLHWFNSLGRAGCDGRNGLAQQTGSLAPRTGTCTDAEHQEHLGSACRAQRGSFASGRLEADATWQKKL